MSFPLADTTYVVPLRRTAVTRDDELTAYLAELTTLLPVIVADGSPPEIFAEHARTLPRRVQHVRIDDDRRRDLNGKVAGVVTALRRVRTPKAVVADDDVRYDPFALRRMSALLDHAGVVRPQNVFTALPWHAVLDSGRTLIARATGGDWPGTLGLNMHVYRRANGYDGDVLFENLELVRTMVAVGARELRADDLFVPRRPPSTRHFLSQRVRQAYDEFARPARMATQLALLPAVLLGTARAGATAPLAFAVGAMMLAEAGRRRGGATRVIGPAATLCAPLWVTERALTAWVAVTLRAACGGVRYSHGRLRKAANSPRALRRRYAEAA